MIIEALIWLVAVLAFVQPSLDRFYVATIFAAATLGHYYGLGHLDGLAYFGSGALIDLGIISVTAALPRITGLTLDVHRVCLASVVLNAVGWAAWMLYLPGDAYVAASVLLYVWAVITLIKPDQCDERGHGAVDRRTSWLCRDYRSCRHNSTGGQAAP